MGKPRGIEIAAAVCCLCGIYLISDASLADFSYGDLLIIGSALCIALGIIVTEKASLVSHNLLLLTFYQIAFTLLLPLYLLGKQVLLIPANGLFWWGVIYCGIFATVVPLFLQLKYQPLVGSNKVAIIFSLEALTATLCAWLVGEPIASSVLGGGIVVLFSALLHDLWALFKPSSVAQRSVSDD